MTEITTMELAIESCSVFHWRELAALFRTAFPDIPEPEISYQLRNYLPDIRLARVSGELAGFTITIREKTPRTAWLEQIAVHPKFRKRGIARALLDDFEASAARLGALNAELAVYKTNESAIALYESCGYLCIQKDGDKYRFRKGLPSSGQRARGARSSGVIERAWLYALYSILTR